MRLMDWYRARLEVKGATLTAWSADTIFGHFCWFLRREHGEARLRELLDACINGSPPLLVSNGFPGDLLPRPVLPRPPRDSTRSLPEQMKDFDLMKKASEISLVSAADFDGIRTGKAVVVQKPDTGWSRCIALKNQINRLTGTTGEEASLFSVEEHFTPLVTVYLKVSDKWTDNVGDFFTAYLTASGYGKRKTVGYGRVSTAVIEAFPGFITPAAANGFVSLSNFVPAAGDPVRGWWRVLVKYGKLGEEYAAGGDPFKKPLIMLEAGSCFYDTPVREYYGRAVTGVSSQYSQVIQYGFALPVPAVLPDRP